MLTKSTLANWVAFAIAVLWFVNFRLVGQVYVSELALILVFLFMFQQHGRKLLAPIPKRILLFGLLWFFSQVVTDFVRATPIESLLKGWAAILFFLVDFSALYMLLGSNERRLKVFVWGVAFGGIIQPFISPSEYFEVDPWKFGFGMPVILASILIVTWASKKRLYVPIAGEFILLLLGLVSFYLNARSLGASVILTAMLLFIGRRRLFSGILHKRLNFFSVIAISAVSLTMLLATFVTYKWVGESGFLPENAQVKFESSQSSFFGPLGTILSGRIEIFASIHAVVDSPIIGHGSWAEDPKYRYFLYDVTELPGVERSEESLKQFIESADLIPAHSHLMQAWVWSGLLGAVFWVVILSIILKSLLNSIRNPGVLSMITVFICIKMGWDLLFSPFGSWLRFTWGWELVLIIMTYTIAQSVRSDRKELDHADTELESWSPPVRRIRLRCALSFAQRPLG